MTPKIAVPKIALYGYGSSPVTYRHLIDMARAQGQAIEWCAILTQPNYRGLIGEVLPAAEILDVFRDLPRVPVGGPASELTGYAGSLAQCGQTRKFREGHIVLTQPRQQAAIQTGGIVAVCIRRQ